MARGLDHIVHAVRDLDAAADLYRRFGFTVSPRDVEWALLENQLIREALVVGQPAAGEPNDKLLFFISGDISQDQVTEYCKANLPFSWRPDRVIILPALPRTRNGKPKLAELKAMVA